MSVYVSGCVWKHSQAKGSDLLVLLAIAEIAGEDGVARPQWDTSVKRLATMTRLSERAVQYCLRALQEIGELAVEGPTRQYRANTFQILLDRNHSLFEGPGVPVDKLREPAVDNSPTADSMGATGFTSGCNPASSGVQPVAPDPSARLSRQTPHTRARKSKAVDKPTAAELTAGWLERGLQPSMLEWAQAHGWHSFIELHLGYFRDYLAANPTYAVKHKDLDACFRNCVRADWGDVRKKAQLAAAHGRGVDLEGWWKTSDGIKAKGFSLSIPYDKDAFIKAFTDRVPRHPEQNREWRGEELQSYGWREYEATVLDAVVDRDGWGAWVDEKNRSQEFRMVCRRRMRLGKPVPKSYEGEVANAR